MNAKVVSLTEREITGLASLVSLGYLDAKSNRSSIDATVTRAVKRFQRHATRPYRLPENTPDIFHGRDSGVLDSATLIEIEKWIQRGWTLPLGVFALVSIPQGGKLRSDAASAWAAIVAKVTSAGGTLEGPYGDTTRGIDFKAGTGASRYSFHYAGRAIDLNQALAGGRKQRYFVAKELNDGALYWRIYCKVEGEVNGVVYKAKTMKYYDFYSKKELDLPGGRYIDLTMLIEADGKFERIRAQVGWESNSKKAEWWHFQYTVDCQATIQDDLELIGYSQMELLRSGWTIKELDHAPG
ncbi:hypothetical protein [Nevskia sp.]|uniref:hypothetical protein n=1 Tax=Nevskia sp. TaxID=1929292 RepID=UPI0025D8910D|nr:hypothetical protein [Nevskia sp.]